MTYLFPPEGDGHTALSEEDRIGLLLPEVATRGDLYGAEQRNISRALMRPLPTARALLDDRFLAQPSSSNVWPGMAVGRSVQGYGRPTSG